MCGILYFRKLCFRPQHRGFNLFDPFLIRPIDTPIKNQVAHLFEHGLLATLSDQYPLHARGPDKAYCQQVPCQRFLQTVLSIRGPPNNFIQTKQKLLYNGEVWQLDGVRPEGLDTEVVFRLLQQAVTPEQVAKSLCRINGDFAIVYRTQNWLHIAKDRFGKKSLLLGLGEDFLCLSSVPLGQNRSAQLEPFLHSPVDKKYAAEYLSAINKNWLQLPASTLVSVNLGEETLEWRLTPLVFPTVPLLPGKSLEETVLHLLRQSVRMMSAGLDKALVLFSGGLDSSLITKLLDEQMDHLASIELATVCCNQKAHDWTLSAQSHLELQAQSKRVLLHHRYLLSPQDVKGLQRHVGPLIFPKTTTMDMNIASLLYAAARCPASSSKVVFSGLGADQLFGGYSRYRVAWLRGEARDEMRFDLDRIWVRNLGRDDRAIGSCGREARYPFLQQSLVEFVQTLDQRQLFDFDLPRGQGDKLLLRKVGRLAGCGVGAVARKKAVQFGTGLARQSNIERHGSNRKGKGAQQY